MTPTILGPVIGALGVTAGAWFTYRAQRRVAAGRVETSEASALWNAYDKLFEKSEGIRGELAEELVATRAELKENKTALVALQVRLADVERQLVEQEIGCAKQIDALTRELARLRGDS